MMIKLKREEISSARAAAINALIDRFTELTSAMLDDDSSDSVSGDVLNDISVAMMYSLAGFTAFEFRARAPDKDLNDNQSRMFVATKTAALFNEMLNEQFAALGTLTPDES